MAYGKKSGGCTPITAKIQKTTKGGIVQPILNVGKVSPVKMKGDLNKDGQMSGYEKTRQDAIDKAMSSPAKLTPSERRAQSNKARIQASKAKEAKKAAEAKAKAIRQNELDKSKPLSEYLPTTRKAVEKRMKAFDAKYGNKTSAPKAEAPKTSTTKSSGGSMTPYSVENGKGKIHGPKVSYDMAYKNRDMKTYGKMSKSEYIAEAKRQTKSFESTGKWGAPKPRKKQTSVKTNLETKPISIENKKQTANIEIKPTVKKATVKVDPKKAAKVANISRRANKSKAKSEAAAAAGNTKKAERLQKRSERQEARASRQANKAIEPKVDKKELRRAKRKAIKEQKAKFKSAKKEIKSYIDY